MEPRKRDAYARWLEVRRQVLKMEIEDIMEAARTKYPEPHPLPGAPNTTLGEARVLHWMIELRRRPDKPPRPMRDDPEPEWWPGYRPDYAKRDISAAERVSSETPIEVVASRLTDLRPSGSGRLVGLCPLHTERTPSFTVYLTPHPGHWHCYGCNQGGDSIALIRRIRDA